MRVQLHNCVWFPDRPASGLAGRVETAGGRARTAGLTRPGCEGAAQTGKPSQGDNEDKELCLADFSCGSGKALTEGTDFSCGSGKEALDQLW